MDRVELERQRTERDLRDVIKKCKALMPAEGVRPDDSPALRNLDAARTLACLGLVQLGGGDLAGAMSINANVWKIYNLAVTQAMTPAFSTGCDVHETFADANKKRSKNAEAQHADWQRRANDLWSSPQHAGKSKSDIARLIAKATGDYWDTIRKKIKRQ